ncbi:uncharacterized protein LOC131215905 [Anopheles bellator]|uniref:uncharacterized protein LOC131215905 n=1 Tax=Anopheles bellator TaxID=139047 RepID=UPI002649F3EA|nr:uncharacterized protein LOC131215905 [Anopheles bellator]
MVIATQIRPCSSSGLNAGDSSAEEQSIGATVRQTLQCANRESRAIVGLSESIHALSKTPEEFLFCFLATGTDHMHEVLLEAFCFEHDIYIIKLDNADKLSRTLGSTQLASCALVQKRGPETVTLAEDELVDYCEAHWEEPIKPIVKLPEK